jgi:hypothetical protein
MFAMFRIPVTAAVLAASVLWNAFANADDLVLHLTFDQLSADGASTPDVSGQGRQVRLHGQKLVDGVLGKALQFDGYPDQVVDLGDLKLRAPATVMFWFKTRDIANDRCLFSQSAGPATQAGALRFHGQIDVRDHQQWQGIVTGSLRHDTWTHLAVVFDASGQATAYLNGQAQEPVKAGFDFDGVPATLGGPFLGQHGFPFTGELDDVRLHRRALPAGEIQTIYRQAGAK